MDLPIGEILKYGSFFGFIIGALSFTWKIFTDLIKKNEEAKNRLLDRQYEKNIQLEKEKQDLRKELEEEKIKNVETMINGVKVQIEGLYTKFNEVNGRYIELKTKHDNLDKEVQRDRRRANNSKKES